METKMCRLCAFTSSRKAYYLTVCLYRTIPCKTQGESTPDYFSCIFLPVVFTLQVSIKSISIKQFNFISSNFFTHLFSPFFSFLFFNHSIIFFDGVCFYAHRCFGLAMTKRDSTVSGIFEPISHKTLSKLKKYVQYVLRVSSNFT